MFAIQQQHRPPIPLAAGIVRCDALRFAVARRQAVLIEAMAIGSMEVGDLVRKARTLCAVFFRGQVRHRPGCGGGATRQRQQTGGPQHRCDGRYCQISRHECLRDITGSGRNRAADPIGPSIENAPAFWYGSFRFK